MKVMSPIGELDLDGAISGARRAGSLNGMILGLLYNGKPNADIVLETAFDRLHERYCDLVRTRYDKHVVAAGSGAASPEWLMGKICSEATAVINASGD